MSSELDQAREERLAALRACLQKISARLLMAASNGRPEDWRLLGRSVGRVERGLRWQLAQASDLEELQQVSDLYLVENFLETQVQSTYLFARTHKLGTFRDEAMEAKMALLLDEAAG